MRKYWDFITDRAGPLADATVSVYEAGTVTPAALFSDEGVTPVANPVTTDSGGYYSFYVANGLYDVVIAKTGYDTRTIPNFLIEDAITAAVSADVGDADVTLTPGLSSPTTRFASAITADRAVTLSTIGAENGDRFRIVRTAAATGAFNVNVGSGPLKALAAAGTWCDVEFDGTNYILTAAGTL